MRDKKSQLSAITRCFLTFDVWFGAVFHQIYVKLTIPSYIFGC